VLLAISAIDVAFVSAIAALVSALVAPLSSWLISRGGWSHSRRLASDERIFESRARLYEDIIRDGKNDLRFFNTALDSLESAVRSIESDSEGSDVGGPEVPPVDALGTPSEWDELGARMSVIGSEQVVEKHQAFRDAMGRALGHAKESLANKRSDFEEQRMLFKTAARRLDELARVMRTDLSN
jgi:hypothetical protein